LIVSNQQIHTACPYCGVGCGVLASIESNGDISVSGDPDHPANQGRLCSKGSALAETLVDDNRLLHPVVDNKATTWQLALNHIAGSLTQTIETHGRESVAFYVSGQLLSEDYYVVNKFTKGWLGTANIDTNSRLCMASSVVGHKRAFGTDTVPGCYEDLELADVIVLVGSNLAWCHPVLYQRIMTEKQRRPALFIVVVDPRRTATADMADLHLPINVDGDTLLFNGLLTYLVEHDICDQDYISKHVSGFDNAVSAAKKCVTGPVTSTGLATSTTNYPSISEVTTSAQPQTLSDLAQRLGIDVLTLTTFYEKVADNPKTVTLFSQGVNQSTNGTDKVNAIINTHLATGRIGRPGMGPFSITGQPNAMGGREVGGLATMLAAHMELQNSEHRRIVQQFWQSPHIADAPGHCAVDLFNAVADGRIKAIWIMGTNPVDSLPDADSVSRALAACPLVIVSDVSDSTDTLAFADVLLPAQAWGEKDGTVTNSERCISRQRAIKAPAGSARPDWWAVSQVAQRMGFGSGFNYQRAADIFREHAALSAIENKGSRDFDIGAASTLSNDDYQQLAPFYWPWTKQPVPTEKFRRLSENPTAAFTPNPQSAAPAQPIRFFSRGRFYTPSGKASMLPVTAVMPGNARLSDRYPLILNTGRIRDQWHSMTRTGYSPRLSCHLGEPFMEVHPNDALIHGIKDADIIRVRSEQGTCLLRASLSDRQRPGQVFSPMHWTNVFSSSARVDSLIAPLTDPHSRQPAFKNQPVSIQRFNATSYAYVLHRQHLPRHVLEPVQYWALSPVEQGWRYEMASELSTQSLLTLITSLAEQSRQSPGKNVSESNNSNSIQNLFITDSSTSSLKYASFRGSQLQTLIMIANEPVEISRSWAQQQLLADWSNTSQRYRLLAGRAPADQPDKGAIVCSCFQVGTTEIETAVTEHRCLSLQSIGQRLQAGTNCGSCRSEIQGIVKRCNQTLKRKCTTSPSRMM